MSRSQLEEVVKFVEGSMHGWTLQPRARIVSAGFDTNPDALCVEITVMVGHAFSQSPEDYRPEATRVFTMGGARVALGY